MRRFKAFILHLIFALYVKNTQCISRETENAMRDFSKLRLEQKTSRPLMPPSPRQNPYYPSDEEEKSGTEDHSVYRPNYTEDYNSPREYPLPHPPSLYTQRPQTDDMGGGGGSGGGYYSNDDMKRKQESGGANGPPEDVHFVPQPPSQRFMAEVENDVIHEKGMGGLFDDDEDTEPEGENDVPQDDDYYGGAGGGPQGPHGGPHHGGQHPEDSRGGGHDEGTRGYGGGGQSSNRYNRYDYGDY